MKKLTIGLAALLSGYAANSFATLPTGVASRCDVNVPSYCGGFYFGLKGLYWRASSPNLDYALSAPTFSSTDVFAFSGENHRLRHRYEWGWQANAGYFFPCSGNDVNVTYTHWDHSRSDHINGVAFPDFFPFSAFSLFSPASFRFGPPTSLTIAGTGIGTSSDDIYSIVTTIRPAPNCECFNVVVEVAPEDITAVRASASFKNDTWDLDFGQAINVGCNFHVRWFGGARYTRLEHKLDTVIEATGTIATTGNPFTGFFTVTNLTEGTPSIRTTGTAVITFDGTAAIRDAINQKSHFDGVGPRFGLDLAYHVGCGFGIVGSLSTSLLVGEIESHLNNKLDVTPTPVGTAEVVTTGVWTPDIVEEEVVTGGFPGQPPIPVSITGLATAQTDTFSFRHPDETRVVPNIDAKLGVDWTYVFCNCSHTKLSVEAGYLISHYFNAADRLSIIGAFAPEFRTRHTIDVSFDGPYVGVNVAL